MNFLWKFYKRNSWTILIHTLHFLFPLACHRVFGFSKQWYVFVNFYMIYYYLNIILIEFLIFRLQRDVITDVQSMDVAMWKLFDAQTVLVVCLKTRQSKNLLFGTSSKLLLSEISVKQVFMNVRIVIWESQIEIIEWFYNCKLI